MKYACPECHTEDVTVQVSAFVPLIQTNGTTTIDADDAELDWDSCSSMMCTECSHTGYASQFKTE
ncbi:hypothetical protein L1D14_04440 [Vibrio tubiashii]|uniref:hypothetical protein n=1 Tax=Vibrio tubiashii TaxID=29498 RepID=UPI001EFD2E59|nr:hypothetical protein [Vibrio tubiashii]MCG9575481.1 hypothetical protein [Vibrio tubiashii]